MRRDVLFDVYVQLNSGHRVGFAQHAEGFYIAQEKSGKSEGSIRSVSTIAGVNALALKLRGGYTKTERRRYFNARSAAFCEEHPELGTAWLLAAIVPRPQQAVEAVCKLAAGLPKTVILPEEVAHWAKWQEAKESYVTAGDDSCLWALLLAQASMERGWALRSHPGHGRLPDQPPAIAPSQWASWLAKSFSASSIEECLQALGWTVEHIISSGILSKDDGNLSAFF
jgi:hypothetical protein